MYVKNICWFEINHSLEVDSFLKSRMNKSQRYFNLANYATEQSFIEEADELYQKALQCNPENGEYRLKYSNFLVENERHYDALEHLNIIISTSPEWDLPYMVKGKVHYQLEQYIDSRNAFFKAHSIKPDRVEALFSLAHTEHILGKYKDARKLYEKLLKFEPANNEVKHNIAHTYYEMGEFEQVRTILEPLCSNVNFELSHSLLGLTYSRLNQNDHAINSFKQAISFRPGKLSNYFHLASIYREQLMINDAIELLEFLTTQSYGENSSTAYFLLAKVYCDIGNTEKAKFSLKKSLNCSDITVSLISQININLKNLNSCSNKDSD